MQTHISEGSQIEAAIKDALRARIGRQAEDIAIQVQDGTATLAGPIVTWEQRDAVIDVARHTPGVLQVKDHLRLLGFRVEW